MGSSGGEGSMETKRIYLVEQRCYVSAKDVSIKANTDDGICHSPLPQPLLYPKNQFVPLNLYQNTMQRKQPIRKTLSLQKPKAPTQPLPPTIPQKKGFTVLPSAKLTKIKTIDPFAQNKGGHSFAHIYSAGSIPCRVDSGSINMKLRWNNDVVIAELPYDPLLVSCFEGLTEEKHPYGFIAYNCAKDMLLDQASAEKLILVLPKLVWPLRSALGFKAQQVAERGLDVLKMLSDKVGSHLNSSVKSLVTPIVKHIGNKKLRDKIYVTLQTLEENGGPEVLKIIKAAIPTYSSM